MGTYPTNPTDASGFVLEIAKLLRGDIARVVALKQFFVAGDTEAAADALGVYAEGHVAGLIRGVAIEAMALACMKACDREGPDRYTIPTAKHLLAVTANFDAVAMRGDRQALTHFLRLADEIKGDYAEARLREFRNFSLVHHIPEKFAKTERAILLHLWDMIDSVQIAVYQLAAGTGIATVTFDADAEVWKERCEDYWRRLLEGPRGKQIIKR